jgi:hypothetical protein
MHDLNERIRKFMEIVASCSEKRLDFWDKVPRIRLGEEFLNAAKRVVEHLTSGVGDLTESTAEVAFLSFLISSRGSEIREAIDRAQGAPVYEIQGTEEDLEKPPEPSTPQEEWRG